MISQIPIAQSCSEYLGMEPLLQATSFSERIKRIILNFLYAQPVALCVEIGKTRIKAAIVPKNLTLASLRDIQTIALASSTWLHNRLPALFHDDAESPLRAFLQDMREFISSTFSIQVASIMVGGGFSRFITPSENPPLPTMIFSPQYLAQNNLSPDILQLLGCQMNSRQDYMRTQLYPSPATLLRAR